MRRFFYPFEGIDAPIDWMCCTTARIQKNKQEEPMEPNNKIPVYYEMICTQFSGHRFKIE